MTSDRFFLCDLTHTGQVINSDVMPYPIGCIKSHFLAHGDKSIPIDLIKYPHKLTEKFEKNPPTLIGFSNYSWNCDLSYTFAEAVKKRLPEALVIFGGPNYPLEPHRQEAWLKARPAVDLYIIGEGEIPFLEVASLWLKHHNVERIRKSDIYGVHSIVDGKHRKNTRTRSDNTEDQPRLKNLDSTPSPYLNGYMDEFVLDPKLVPLVESTRGCPFTCSFCRDGVSSLSKVNRVRLSRLESELTYIAERYSGTNLVIADDNFGMYKEDLEFSRIIAATKKKFGYPDYLEVSTGKNKRSRAIECANILEGSLRFTGSVQSLDTEVLNNVKRTNISYEQLIDISAQASTSESNTYSELILGLPADSLEKHKKGVGQLIDARFDQIRIHTLMILDGSELSTDRDRKAFNLKTRYRALARSFGVYPFCSENLPSVEIEAVCVENESMPFEDYVECRRFALTVALFYNERVFYEVTQFLLASGFLVSDWIRYVHDHVSEYSPSLRKVYDRFTQETRDELWMSRQDVESRVKNKPGVIESYIRGERGNNILMNASVQVQIENAQDTHDVAFRCVAEFAKLDKMKNGGLYRDYLEELKRFSFLKKRNVLDIESVFVEEFGFDFLALQKAGCKELPREKTPTTIRFYYDNSQKDYFTDQFRRHGTSPQALGKIFNRIAVKRTYRVAAIASARV